MNFDNIPAELRELPRWVTFDIEGDKKIPYVAGNCAKASSNTPSTWRTFEEAVADVTEGKRQHLGLAIQHPYFFLDLDEPHPEILESIDTYAHKSISGRGTHLIGRGSFEGTGKHPKAPHVGLFKENRFVLFTGDIVDDRNEIKDVDEDTLQSIHTWLSNSEFESTTTTLVEFEPSLEDQTVLSKARERFDTFQHLWEGNAGPDHSESDHALIAMLADCSDSNEQVRRLWFSCPLCRDHRRNSKYVDRSLKKIRGKQETLDSFFEEEIPTEEESKENFQDIGNRDMIDSLPEGLIKRIADWHWTQSLYPLQEASISVAFSVMATVAGRSYQTITRSGLNPWIILLAGTSWGKNEYSNGISGLFGKLDTGSYSPVKFSRMVGGSAASGEGLEDQLLRNPRLNSYFPEFDTIFKNLTSPNPPPYIQSLTRFILDLYGRSGKDAFLKKRFKARGKEEEDVAPVQAPCLVISGETIAEKLYNHMNLDNIESGFLQRFSLFEAEKSSVSVLANPQQGTPIPEDLVDELIEFFTHCEVLDKNNEFVTVEAEEKAREVLFAYVNDKRRESLTTKAEGVKQALNRAGFKLFKFASLFAVASDWRNPVIQMEHVRWSMDFVDSCDGKLLDRFQSGRIGTGQGQQESEIKQIFEAIRKMPASKRTKEGIPASMSKQKYIVPYGWLKRRAISLGAFSSDRGGSVAAFERCLNHMTAAGELLRVSTDVMEEKFGKGCGPGVSFREAGK